MLWNYKTYSCAGDIFTILVDSTVSMIKFTAFKSLTRKRKRAHPNHKSAINTSCTSPTITVIRSGLFFSIINTRKKKCTGVFRIKVLLWTINKWIIHDYQHQILTVFFFFPFDYFKQVLHDLGMTGPSIQIKKPNIMSLWTSDLIVEEHLINQDNSLSNTYCEW